MATELFQAEAHKIGVMVHILTRPIEPVAWHPGEQVYRMRQFVARLSAN